MYARENSNESLHLAETYASRSRFNKSSLASGLGSLRSDHRIPTTNDVSFYGSKMKNKRSQSHEKLEQYCQSLESELGAIR